MEQSKIGGAELINVQKHICLVVKISFAVQE